MHGAIPQVYFESNSSLPAAYLAVHVLDHLYKKLDEVCLVRGGEVGTSFIQQPLLFLVYYSCLVSPGLCNPNLVLMPISGGRLPDASLFIYWKYIAIY